MMSLDQMVANLLIIINDTLNNFHIYIFKSSIEQKISVQGSGE